MEPTDQYNFSIFRPRNLHGRKNRNVILSMLLIWAVAVFGFQFLLRGIQKPTPEKTLMMFESAWPSAIKGMLSPDDSKTLLKSLILVRGKNTVKPENQKILSDAISCVLYGAVPDTVKLLIINSLSEIKDLKARLADVKEQEYLDIKSEISGKSGSLISVTESYTGIEHGSLESSILINSLVPEPPILLSDISFSPLPGIMKLYLTHNQSVLTDTKFLGFPFHYFYTAVLLLILFIILCIVYNVLIEWWLKRGGIVE
jgi:uncharacterized membrane protein